MIVLLTWPGKLIKDIFVNINNLLLNRDILITPKRINYAREKEKDLYESLITITNSQQNEIQKIIIQAVDDMQETLTDQASSLDIHGTFVC